MSLSLHDKHLTPDMNKQMHEITGFINGIRKTIKIYDSKSSLSKEYLKYEKKDVTKFYVVIFTEKH